MSEQPQPAPLSAEEVALLRALLTRVDGGPAPQPAPGGGVSVLTNNAAGELDNFSSPTFKSLSCWFPRVKSSTLDLIINGTFEVEDLAKLGSRLGAKEKGRPLMWFSDSGAVGVDGPPDELTESGIPRLFLRDFPSIIPLLDAFAVYTGIRTLLDPTGGGVAAAFSIFTHHLLEFVTQFEWTAVLRYFYEFLRVRLTENFLPSRWVLPDQTLVATCLVRYPLTLPSSKKRALQDRFTSTPSSSSSSQHTKLDETCFKFNSSEGCRMGDNCARRHICVKCGGSHSSQTCSGK